MFNRSQQLLPPIAAIELSLNLVQRLKNTSKNIIKSPRFFFNNQPVSQLARQPIDPSNQQQCQSVGEVHLLPSHALNAIDRTNTLRA